MPPLVIMIMRLIISLIENLAIQNQTGVSNNATKAVTGINYIVTYNRIKLVPVYLHIKRICNF